MSSWKWSDEIKNQIKRKPKREKKKKEREKLTSVVDCGVGCLQRRK
jgi:hypothetical protein